MTTTSSTPQNAPVALAAAARPSVPAVEAPVEKSSGRKRIIGISVALVAAIAGTSYWAYERQFEDTDDAQIEANISNISPRVTGTVSAVNVIENQRVKVGDVLAEIDPSDLKVAVDLARAQVAQAQAQLEVEDPSVSITEMSNRTTEATSGADLASAAAGVAQSKKSVDQLAAQLVQAQANDKNAQIERQRAEQLIKQGAITQSEYDQRSAAAEASAANVDALRQALEAARAGVGEQVARLSSTQSRLAEIKANAPRQLATRRASVLWRQAELDAAKAQLAQAELNLGYAKILSPVPGIVGKKGVDVGDHVAPGQEIFAISQTDAVWVTANFRETQLRSIHPGQVATVHVDALDADLRGSVESIGGATGSRYSVLPPENASGNYVKVVQRIPVRIKLDPGQPGMERLRAGMSVEPKVKL
jgi:membrane fusion protein, multidrug efflux system